MTIPNGEEYLRMLKETDPDQFLIDVRAQLLNKSEKGNELYMVSQWSDSILYAYFLRYVCPSTNKVYVKGIRPDIGWEGDADIAQAWSFGLTLQEYQNLAAET